MGTESANPVVVHDIEHSQVIVGSGNFAMQLWLDGHAGYSDRSASVPLTPRPLAVINPRRSAPEPVGRTAVVDQAEAALRDGRSVQLCGTPGVGKTAVAEAVARRLAGAAQPGVVLAGGRPRAELLPLYSELAKVFFSVDWYEPDETVLRAETGRHLPNGVIVIPDCELSAADAERLLGTFPDCVFLLCSPQQSLYTGETVLDVEPLGLDATRALVERELGRPLEGFENIQVQHVHELSEGRISRVLVCAAFLRRATADARQYGVVPLSPRDQIAVLLNGVSEPARRVLTALCAFGPASEELLGTLAGGVQDPAAAADELEHAGLATRTGDLVAATEDAREAVAGQGWAADPRFVADELIRLLVRARRGADAAGGADTSADQAQAAAQATAVAVDPRLCVTVAQALLDGGDPDRASALSRVAAPAALAGGDVGSWKELVTIGLRAAREGARGDDLVYFLTEEHTRSLLTGDRIAAAAALAALGAALMHGGVMPFGPGVHHPAPPKAPNRPRTSLRQAVQERFGRGVATAVMVGAPVAAGAAVVGTGFGAAAVTRPAAAPAQTAVTAPSASGTVAAAAASSAAAAAAGGAAAVYPYGIGNSPVVRDGGGASPYEDDADYPTITGLADKTLEQKINAALSGQSDLASFPPSGAGTEPGQTAPDPATMSVSSEVFQSGRLVSVLYLSFFHFAGAGDTNYGLRTVTVRTDTGEVISPSAILSPAATTTDLTTLVNDLQAQGSISFCDESSGHQGVSELTSAVQSSTAAQPTFATTVTSTGLLFSFEDGAISGTACRPMALLTWQQLDGMVNPQVLSLAQEPPAGSVVMTPAPVPTPTGPPVTASSAVAPAASTHSTPSTPRPTDPASVVNAYYAAINAHDFATAWALGGKNLNSDYEAFSSGYGQTKSAVITIDSVSGDTVSVTLHATQDDGTQKTYAGTYTVRDGVITSADLH